MKKIISIITTIFLLGSIIALSYIFIIKPNINNLNIVNSIKDLSETEINSKIDTTKSTYNTLENEIITKYDSKKEILTNEYNTNLEEISTKYNNLEKEINEKYDLLDKNINQKIKDIEYKKNKEFFAHQFSKTYYKYQEEIETLQKEKTNNSSLKFNEITTNSTKKTNEERTLKTNYTKKTNLLEDKKNNDIKELNDKKEKEINAIKNSNNDKKINKIKYTLLIILGIVIILIPFIIIAIVFNELIHSHNKVKSSWSTIDVLLKQRTDLIPNLVTTIKGYSKHEEKTLKNITKARENVINSNNKIDNIKNNEKLTNEITKLLALNESYPELKSDKNYLDLQNKLSEVETNISNARIIYNKDVLNYKNLLEQFPTNIIASIFNFKDELFFEIDKDEKNNPNINFN